MQGGGGPLLTGTSAQSVSEMSSRIYFGICPTIPVGRNVGQTLIRLARLAKNVPTCFQHSALRSLTQTPPLATARACNQERGLACRALDSTQGKPCSVALLGLAFTMAEILLSLTIIGVVAAITLPSLTGNINERTWNTQRKALYARMSQAIALMPSLNGYGVLKEETDSAGSTSIVDTAAETFITGGLAKVLKINNICDYEHLEDCGIPEKYNDLLGSKHSFPKYIGDLNSDFIVPSSFWGGSYSLLNTRLAAFETANGESVAVFYNPYCNYANEENTGSYYYSQQTICANLIYDLNGQKGPNTFGKDIGFITFIYPTNTLTVMPMPYNSIAGYTTAKLGTSLCREKFGEDAKLLDRFEYAALFVNKNLTGLNFNNGTYQLTSSRYFAKDLGVFRYWHFNFERGTYRADDNDAAGGIYCVKRN